MPIRVALEKCRVTLGGFNSVVMLSESLRWSRLHSPPFVDDSILFSFPESVPQEYLRKKECELQPEVEPAAVTG